MMYAFFSEKKHLENESGISYLPDSYSLFTTNSHMIWALPLKVPSRQSRFFQTELLKKTIVCFYGNDWGQWSKVLPGPIAQGVKTPLIFGIAIYFLWNMMLHPHIEIGIERSAVQTLPQICFWNKIAELCRQFEFARHFCVTFKINKQRKLQHFTCRLPVLN